MIGTIMNENLLLFDLDNTMVQSNDLESFRGVQNLNKSYDQQYRAALINALGSNPSRQLLSEGLFNSLREAIQNVKLGVFTRSPKAYTEILLNTYFPNVNWDIVIHFETHGVTRTKPNPDGIWHACRVLGIQNCMNVTIVGDDAVDTHAAYAAGANAISYSKSWGRVDFASVKLIPDAIVDSEIALYNAIMNPFSYKAFLEGNTMSTRYDENLWEHAPKHKIDSDPLIEIPVLGKYFVDKEPNKLIASIHPLTKQMHEFKEKYRVPTDWALAVVNLLEKIRNHYTHPIPIENCILTVIPGKPWDDRNKLEYILDAIRALQYPMPILDDIFYFTEGVLSQHHEYLNKAQRIANIRDHLKMKPGIRLLNKSIFVLDDVITTGTTLHFAKKLLRQNSAKHAFPLAIAQTIS